MQKKRKYVSGLLGLFILVASLLPALHAFEHTTVTSKENPALSLKISKINCELCDFQISNIVTPPVFIFETLPPQKEIAYAISLAETVNLFPNPLFSLRAPPIV